MFTFKRKKVKSIEQIMTTIDQVVADLNEIEADNTAAITHTESIVAQYTEKCKQLKQNQTLINKVRKNILDALK